MIKKSSVQVHVLIKKSNIYLFSEISVAKQHGTVCSLSKNISFFSIFCEKTTRQFNTLKCQLWFPKKRWIFGGMIYIYTFEHTHKKKQWIENKGNKNVSNQKLCLEWHGKTFTNNSCSIPMFQKTCKKTKKTITYTKTDEKTCKKTKKPWPLKKTIKKHVKKQKKPKKPCFPKLWQIFLFKSHRFRKHGFFGFFCFFTCFLIGFCETHGFFCFFTCFLISFVKVVVFFVFLHVFWSVFLLKSKQTTTDYFSKLMCHSVLRQNIIKPNFFLHTYFALLLKQTAFN